MKALLTISLMSLMAAVAFGQGTVFFANDSVTLPSPPDRLIRFGGVPATGTNYQVQLYVGADAFSLNSIGVAPARLRPSNTTIPGVWSGGGDRTLIGWNFGEQVVLQVRLWSIFDGATFEQAFANPSRVGLLGSSAPFLYQIPASPANPPADFFMVNFSGFDPIPEPGTFALVGVGALLLCRRRK